MKRRRHSRPIWDVAPVDHSPLRRADPRTKLALSLAASLAVMLPLPQLIIAMIAYGMLLAWARLLAVAARQVWRLKWLLLGLFIIDWVFVSQEHGVLITLRLILLAGSFALFFATTTPAELRLALEWFRIPHRYAFSISMAFQSLGLLDNEWRAVREAQQARGAWRPPTGWRRLVSQVRDLVALSVPAIVLTTRRAWSMTEAAHARGFDSPLRRSYRQLTMNVIDWILLMGTVAVMLALIVLR